MNKPGSHFVFPCTFPLKVMGQNNPQFMEAVREIVARHVPEVSAEDFRKTPSRRDRYVSVTVTFTAHSKAQLDALYQELGEHELVLMTL